jgi:hypothetical protein
LDVINYKSFRGQNIILYIIVAVQRLNLKVHVDKDYDIESYFGAEDSYSKASRKMNEK